MIPDVRFSTIKKTTRAHLSNKRKGADEHEKIPKSP